MRILFVSYHFYPEATSQAVSAAKAAKALAAKGHHVEIITSDISQSNAHQGLTIHRIPKINSLKKEKANDNNFCFLTLKNKMSAISNIVKGSTLEDRTWSKSASEKIIELWTSNQNPPFDVLYSRLNPYKSHLAVLYALEKLPDLPWSAHFSDPYPVHLYPEEYRGTKRSVFNLMEKRLESKLDRILEKARSLTFPSDRLRYYFLTGRRKKYLDKSFFISQLGPCWIPQLEYKKNSRFQILSAGYLLKQRSPEFFLQGLKQFIDNHKYAKDLVNVKFIGRNSKSVEEFLGKYELNNNVSFMPHSLYEEIWPKLSQVDVLLLIESQMKEGIFMPSKLSDYIASKRPILALSPSNGTVSDYISLGGGLRVDPESPNQIANALAEMFVRWQDNTLDNLEPSSHLQSLFSLEKIVPEYEKAFERAIRGV